MFPFLAHQRHGQSELPLSGDNLLLPRKQIPTPNPYPQHNMLRFAKIVKRAHKALMDALGPRNPHLGTTAGRVKA